MAHDLVELADHRVQIHVLWLIGFATDKGENLLGQPPGLMDAPLYPLELLLASLIQRLAAKLLQASQRDGEEVVELMGNPGCDGAYDLDPFRPIFQVLCSWLGAYLVRRRR